MEEQYYKITSSNSLVGREQPSTASKQVFVFLPNNVVKRVGTFEIKNESGVWWKFYTPNDPKILFAYVLVENTNGEKFVAALQFENDILSELEKIKLGICEDRECEDEKVCEKKPPKKDFKNDQTLCKLAKTVQENHVCLNELKKQSIAMQRKIVLVIFMLLFIILFK